MEAIASWASENKAVGEQGQKKEADWRLLHLSSWEMLVAGTTEDTTCSPGAHSSRTRSFTSPAWAQSQQHQGWDTARSPS